MTASHSRRARLSVDALEVRAVPANNLTIQGVSFDDSTFVRVQQTGSTVTIRTKLADAGLSLQTIRNALTDPTVTAVVVTTDVANGQGTTNGDQPGNITWDANAVGSLDFTGFGTGKTLTFETIDEQGAVGNITLTGVAFVNAGTDDRISLVFDSSEPGGDITFQPAAPFSPTVRFSAPAVADATVSAGTGAFAYTAGPVFDTTEVAGDFTVTAGAVTLEPAGGVTAGGSIAVTAGGAVSIPTFSGLTAGDDVTVTAAGAVTGDSLTLTATAGRVSVSGTTVTLTDPLVTAGAGLTLAGSTGIDVDFGTYEVVGDVSITGGAIDLNGVALPNNVSGVGTATVTATGTLTMTDSFVIADGPATVTAAALVFDNVNLGGDTLTVTGPMTLAGLVDFRSNTTITIPGAMNGVADLYLAAGGAITVGSPVGATTPLTSFNVLQGRAALGTNNLSAGTVTVGELFNPAAAVLGLAGTIAGDLAVRPSGTIAPGGVGAVGATVVTGGVTIDGTLAVDFGAAGTFDQLAAPAGVTLGGSSRLGGPLGTGRLTAPTATLIDTAGTITGQFLNAPVGTPVLAGTDVVMVATYSPDLVVVPYGPPGGFGSTATGFDPQDGTLFKATVTGPGTVFSALDWTNRPFLVVRDTTAASTLTITTTANASDDIMAFPVGVLVSGSLAAFNAPKVDIGDQFRASGWVGSAVFRDLLSTSGGAPLQFGGAPVQLTRITARNLFGSVTTGSTLSVLKVAQGLGSQVGIPSLEDSVVRAPAIGTVTAGGATIHVETPGRLTALKVTRAYFGDVTADSVGSLTAGSMTGAVTATKAVTLLKTTGAFEGAVTADSLGTFSAGGGEAVLDVTKRITAIIGTGANDLGLTLSAASVGSIKVADEVYGDDDPATLDWTVTDGIGSLTAGGVYGIDVSAKYLGTTAVKGNLAAGLSGYVANSTFALTGNDGSDGKYGLKALTVQGNVTFSRFDVKTGNVGAVTVGRFQDSQLWVGYTPAASGDFLAGSVANGGKLASFKTTATPLPVAHPLRWAFRGSEVVSGSIGTVTLSGLQTANGGTAFGIKVRNGGAVVKVLKADVATPSLPLNAALTPDNSAPYAALSGDFFFLDV